MSTKIHLYRIDDDGRALPSRTVCWPTKFLHATLQLADVTCERCLADTRMSWSAVTLAEAYETAGRNAGSQTMLTTARRIAEGVLGVAEAEREEARKEWAQRSDRYNLLKRIASGRKAA